MNERLPFEADDSLRTREIVQQANAAHFTIEQFRELLRQRSTLAANGSGQRIVPEDLTRPYVVMVLHDLLRSYMPDTWAHVQEWLADQPVKLGAYVQGAPGKLELHPLPEGMQQQLKTADFSSLEEVVHTLKACAYSVCHHRCQTWEKKKAAEPLDENFETLSYLSRQFSADRSVSGTMSEGFKTSIKFTMNMGLTGLAVFVREFGEQALSEERIMRLFDNGYTELVLPLASSGKVPFMEFEKHAQKCLIRPGDKDRIFTPYLASAFRMSGDPDDAVMSSLAETMPAPTLAGVHVRHGCVAMGKVIEESFQWMRGLYESYVVKNGAWKKFLPELHSLATK